MVLLARLSPHHHHHPTRTHIHNRSQPHPTREQIPLATPKKFELYSTLISVHGAHRVHRVHRHQIAIQHSKKTERRQHSKLTASAITRLPLAHPTRPCRGWPVVSWVKAQT